MKNSIVGKQAPHIVIFFTGETIEIKDEFEHRETKYKLEPGETCSLFVLPLVLCLACKDSTSGWFRKLQYLRDLINVEPLITYGNISKLNTKIRMYFFTALYKFF